MKKFFKISLTVIIAFLLLSIGISMAIRIPAVQDFVLKRVLAIVSSQTDAKVKIGSFSWSMFCDLELYDFYLGDTHGDTLIYAQKLNVDFDNWSLLNKEIKIKAVRLENANVFLETDTDGQLKVAQLFSKKPLAEKTAKSAEKTTSSTSFSWATSLDEIALKGIRFSFKDGKKHQLISVNVPLLDARIDETNLAKKRIVVRSLEIEQPTVVFTKFDTVPKDPNDTSRFHFMPKDWLITWKNVRLSDGQFSFNAVYKQAKEKGTDFNHLAIHDINFAAENGALNRDSVFSQINRLEATDKSGLQVLSSKGRAVVSLTEIRYENFMLQTPNSTIGNQFSMRYSRFDDFNSFLQKVSIGANLKNTSVSMKDLGYFIKGIEPFAHNTLAVSGKVKGRISSLQVQDLFVRSGNGTSLSGNLYAVGLPNLQETFLNIRVKSLTTNATDIRNFVPTLSGKIPKNVDALGVVRFSGDLDGFVTDFVAHGNVVTAIGNAQSDLNFRYNPKKYSSAYSGTLHLADFNLGKWFGDSAIGVVSATAEVNGKGINLPSLDTKIDGTLESFVYKNYDYRNIVMNGRLRNRSFEGDIISADPNIDVTFHGKANWGDSIPEFIFNAQVRNILLKELHLTKADYQLNGTLTADFTGKNIDNLNGLLAVNQLTIRREEERQFVKNITLEAAKNEDGSRELSFYTDRAEATVKGNYSLVQLPKVFKNYFYKTVYLMEDTANLPPQAFTFNVEIDDSFPLFRMIDPSFKSIGSSYVRGSLNSREEAFDLRGFIPEIVYGNYTFKRINLFGDISRQSTYATTNIDRVFSGDSLLLDTVALNLHNVKDGYTVNVQAHDSKRYNRLYTDVLIHPNPSYADISFDNMFSWLGGNQWSVSQGNNIRLRKGDLVIQNLNFTSGNQKVSLETYRKNNNQDVCLRLTLSETLLGDLLGAFSQKMKNVKATLNGSVEVENIYGTPLLLSDMSVRDIQIGKEKLGTLTLKSALNNDLDLIELNGLLAGENNDAAISGFYSLQKSNQQLDLQVRANQVALSFLNLPFFSKYVRDVHGSFSGQLHLSGPLKALDLDGKIKLKDIDVTVSYLNTRYFMNDEEIELSKEGYFDLGELKLRDIKNNTATGSGRIYHTHFKKFRLDLLVNAQNTMFLNTTAKDNSVFYGQIFGTGRVKFTGTIPQVDINATARMTAGTHCYIPINSTYETNRYSFYNFVDKKVDSINALNQQTQVKLTGVNFRLNAEITPDATIDIILDPIAGDVLSVNGSSPSMSIELLRTGDFNIRGLYEISAGKYLFTLQDIVNKRFQLNPGGTINFTGNVYKAQLNADAVYNVRTSMYDLIYDPSQVQTGLSADVEARAKNRIITKLLLKLTGVLEKPNVAFDIVPQDPDPLIKTLVDSKLAVIRNNEAEMNKQAFGLLVMNRFIPSSLSTGNAVVNSNYVSGSAINTVGEFLSSQLSRYMGTFFESVGIKGLDINMNFQQYDQQNQQNTNGSGSPSNTNSQYDTRRELQLALTQRLFNNRLSISAGGNVDFGDKTTTNNGTASTAWTTNVNGNFQVEYSLTKSGTLRARAFNIGSYDNLRQQNVNKTGLGLSYRQDFDNVRELLRRRKKKKTPSETVKTASPPNVPAIQDSLKDN